MTSHDDLPVENFNRVDPRYVVTITIDHKGLYELALGDKSAAVYSRSPASPVLHATHRPEHPDTACEEAPWSSRLKRTTF